MSGEAVVLSPDEQGLKLAFAELVKAYGGQDAAAVECSRAQSRINTYGNRNSPEFAPVNIVLHLEERTHGTLRHPQVTRYLARRQGFGLVKLPDPSALPDGGTWGRFASRLAKESGDVVAKICDALSDDNDVSPAEARGCLKEADENVRVAVELAHALRCRAAESE